MAKRKHSLADVILREYKKNYNETVNTLMRHRAWLDSHQYVVDVIQTLIETKSVEPVITDTHRPGITLQVDLPDGYSATDCRRVIESMSDILPKGTPEYHEHISSGGIPDYHLLTSYMQKDRKAATFDIRFWGWVR